MPGPNPEDSAMSRRRLVPVSVNMSSLPCQTNSESIFFPDVFGNQGVPTCSVLFSHVVISLSWFESLEILVSTAARHGLFWIISRSWSRVMPPLPPAKKTSATRNGRSWTQLRLEMERRHMSLQVAAGGCVSHMSCHRISWGSVHLVQLRHPNRLDSQSYSWTKSSRFEALLYFKSSRAVGYSVCFPCCGPSCLRVHCSFFPLVLHYVLCIEISWALCP